MCGEGNSYPLQNSCLENPTDRGDWQVIVHWVAKSWTLLNDIHSLTREACESWTTKKAECRKMSKLKAAASCNFLQAHGSLTRQFQRSHWACSGVCYQLVSGLQPGWSGVYRTQRSSTSLLCTVLYRLNHLGSLLIIHSYTQIPSPAHSRQYLLEKSVSE